MNIPYGIKDVEVFVGIIDAPIQLMFTNFAIAFGMTYVYLPLMVLPVILLLTCSYRIKLKLSR